MIELRWYIDGEKKVLQQRQKVDVTVRAGMWNEADIARTANYQWTEWADIPVVHAPMVAEVTAESVSYLREISDAPMMQCKRALVACNGDMAKAAEYIRRNRGFYIT